MTRSVDHPDSRSLQQELAGRIEGEVRFDNLSRAVYATDASVYQIVPLGVVIPRTPEDVVRTVQTCRQLRCPLTARGGGTSQAGQAIGPGVVLDCSKYLHRILDVDPQARWVRVEPGIVLDELNARLRPHGLHLPLDISTSDRATIGGMIANNSSGTRSIVYGKTLDYVLELTAVLADGSVVTMRPLSEPEWEARCRQSDHEGECYRVVDRLAAEHAGEISRRYPKILRRVGGYNLDEFVPAASGRGLNLARLVVGSEGTLAVILEARLRLVPLPPRRALCVVQFHDLLEALAAAPLILDQGPSAVELLDRFILGSTRGRSEYEPLRGFLEGDPAAVLIVEFFEQNPGDLAGRLDRLEAALGAHRLGHGFHRAIEAAEQARIWRLRRAALGLSMSERGDAKAISFVEDTAVAPERLRDYIERFQEILAANETHAGFYAHASVGLLHVRPVVDMKTGAGVARFERIASQVADLVLEFGGALSGEHGDGLVRSPFQERMYGPTLYQAFRAIKQTFDPAGILNPGKIVDAAPLAANLRFGAGYATCDEATVFDFSDFGGIGRAAEQCAGVGECRKTLAGTMCPSYMATRDEIDSTRGRANALRLAMAQPTARLLGQADLLRALDLCLECKACKSECPTGVDMARLKAEILHRHRRQHGIPLRARLLADPARWGIWGVRLAPLSNWVTQAGAVRWLIEKTCGLDRRRPLPRFARQTLRDWWAARPPRTLDVERRRVVLFVDTFTNLYEPANGVATIEVLEAAGLSVDLAPAGCCGRPLISQGLLDRARQQAADNQHRLGPVADRGQTLVFLEPSCLSALRDDAPALLRGAQQARAKQVARASLLFEEFLEAELHAGRCQLSLQSGPAHVLLHPHCHQRALGLTAPAVALLARIPGAAVVDAEAGCCGMAGSFGYEKEHFDLSRRIGESRLFPALRARPPGTPIVASGTSCRHQIEHFLGEPALHPAVLLRSLCT